MNTTSISRLVRALPLAALGALVALAACSKSPEERVAKLRSYYTARLNGIIVQAVPVEAAPEEVGEEVGADGPAPGASESAEGGAGVDDAPETPDVPVRQNVSLDILLQHDSPEKLPGITLDIEMVDAAKQQKHAWKLWVDTSKLPKATSRQFTHLLEDLDYVEGDGFNVEVRSPIPPEERSEYREFDGAGG